MGFWSSLFGTDSSSEEMYTNPSKADAPLPPLPGSQRPSSPPSSSLGKYASDADQEEEAAEAARKPIGAPAGWNPAARELIRHVHRNKGGLFRRPAKIESTLKHLTEDISEALNPDEQREMLHEARGVSPRLGELQKVRRKIKKAQTSYFKQLKGGGASTAQLHTARRGFNREYNKPLRSLFRRAGKRF